MITIPNEFTFKVNSDVYSDLDKDVANIVYRAEKKKDDSEYIVTWNDSTGVREGTVYFEKEIAECLDRNIWVIV